MVAIDIFSGSVFEGALELPCATRNFDFAPGHATLGRSALVECEIK